MWTLVSCTEGFTGKVGLFSSLSRCSFSCPCFYGWKNRTNYANLLAARKQEQIPKVPGGFRLKLSSKSGLSLTHKLQNYRKCLQSPESEIRSPSWPLLRQPHLRKPLHHPQNCCLSFQPSQLIPNAEMCARAKCQMLIVHSFQIHLVRLFELLRVPVCRSQHT